LVREELSIHLIVAGEVIHVSQVGSHADQVLQVAIHASQNFTKIENHRSRLLRYIQHYATFSVPVHTGNTVIRPTCTGSGNKDEIARPPDVRETSAGRSQMLNDLCLSHYDLPGCRIQNRPRAALP